MTWEDRVQAKPSLIPASRDSDERSSLHGLPEFSQHLGLGGTEDGELEWDASACGSERRTSLEGPRLFSCDCTGIRQTTAGAGCAVQTSHAVRGKGSKAP